MLHIKFGFIGQAVSEMFESGGRTKDEDGCRSMGILLAHLVSLLMAQVS